MICPVPSRTGPSFRTRWSCDAAGPGSRTELVVGEPATVGRLTVDGESFDVIPSGGFHSVSTEEGPDLAYAMLQGDGADRTGLYLVDLGPGR